MYDDFYEEFAKTVIEAKLEQPAWLNQKRSIVQLLEEEAFGLKSQFKLLHHDK